MHIHFHSHSLELIYHSVPADCRSSSGKDKKWLLYSLCNIDKMCFCNTFSLYLQDKVCILKESSVSDSNP